MEGRWERHRPFLRLDRAALEARLAVPFPGARVREATPLSGGLRNSNYRLRLDGRDDPVVLRLFTADPEACRREVALAERVAGTVPVPATLYADPQADPPFSVTAWIEAARLDDLLRGGDAAAVERAAAAAGETLARIHAFALPEPGFLGPDLAVRQALDLIDGWPEHVAFFLAGPAGTRLGPELSARLRAIVPRMAPRLLPLRGTTTLVHADYKPWNLLVRHGPAGAAGGAWRVAAVLDWEFAFAGPPMVDLAIFLRHRDGLPPAYTRGLLAGYQAAGGHLPADWATQTRQLDLLNLCSMLSQPGGGAARSRDIGALVRATLDGW
jgi:Ser/Thr protein kinase RdoA (MazF antagonist)